MTSDSIQVIEIYPCLQGEGKLIGIPHILIRFTGCKLRCRWCDTPYSSWSPEKAKYTYKDIIKVVSENKHIKHSLITGGAPTLYPEQLKKIVQLLHKQGHYVTLETEGSDFVESGADLLSLSPKFRSSAPIPGEINLFTGKEITISQRDQHEKNRKDYQSMGNLIECHPDYQVKPVISTEEDLIELKELQKFIAIPNHMVWLMPEGATKEQLRQKRKWIAEVCVKEGYNFTDRLHISIYGNKRYV